MAGGDQAATMTVDVGSTMFGRYRLAERLGTGGLDAVWRATDTAVKRTVALRRISLSGLAPEQARVVRQRARRAGRKAFGEHPHVVSTHEVRIADGDVWLVMEHLPSRTLREIVRADGPLSPARVAEIGSAIADALAAGHARGIVHRDVTPGNVLVADDGRVKLTDFGIVDLAGYDDLSSDGAIAYLAPEVAAGELAEPASDVFSLGATLYSAVEGRPPAGGCTDPIQLLELVSAGTVSPFEHAGGLAPILERLLARQPGERPDASASGRLLTDLAGPATPPRTSPSPRTDSPTPPPADPLPAEPVKSDESVVPSKLAEPVVPAGSAEPAAAAGSAKSAEPVALAGTAEPAAAAGSAKPAESAAAAEPAVPAESAKLAESVVPVGSAKSVAPAESGKPDKSVSAKPDKSVSGPPARPVAPAAAAFLTEAPPAGGPASGTESPGSSPPATSSGSATPSTRPAESARPSPSSPSAGPTRPSPAARSAGSAPPARPSPSPRAAGSARPGESARPERSAPAAESPGSAGSARRGGAARPSPSPRPSSSAESAGPSPSPSAGSARPSPSGRSSSSARPSRPSPSPRPPGPSRPASSPSPVGPADLAEPTRTAGPARPPEPARPVAAVRQATAGPATAGSATAGSATAGPATAGPATVSDTLRHPHPPGTAGSRATGALPSPTVPGPVARHAPPALAGPLDLPGEGEPLPTVDDAEERAGRRSAERTIAMAAVLVVVLIIVGVVMAMGDGNRAAPRAVAADPMPPIPGAQLPSVATPAPAVGEALSADSEGRPLIGADGPTQLGSPALPPDVGPIAFTGNPRDAEPCALMDLSWLRQFGAVTPRLPFLPSTCEVGIGPPGAQTLMRVYFEIANASPAGQNSPEAGQVRRVGTQSVVHTATEATCQNRIELQGAQAVVVTLGGVVLDRCAVTEVGTNVAMAALRQHGVTYRPGRTAIWRNAAADACTLLLPGDVAAAGIRGAVRKPGYAHWVCAWLSGPSYVELDINLAEASSVRWEPAVVGGRQAWINRVSTARPAVCQVMVVTRPAPAPGDADEMLSVRTALDRPIDQVCARASTIAAAAAPRVPAG